MTRRLSEIHAHGSPHEDDKIVVWSSRYARARAREYVDAGYRAVFVVARDGCPVCASSGTVRTDPHRRTYSTLADCGACGMAVWAGDEDETAA